MARDYTGQVDPKEAALKRELQPGERILWQSLQYPRLIGSSLPIFLFAIPWTAFSIFWVAIAWFMTSSVASEPDWTVTLFPLFGLPFVAIGIWMLITPFLRYFSARRTIFAVTNQRIIRLYRGKGELCQSVPASRIGKVMTVPGKGGHASVHVYLIGIESDFEPSGDKFIISDVADAENAKKFIRYLGERKSA